MKQKEARAANQNPGVRTFLDYLETAKNGGGWFSAFRETIDLFFYALSRNDEEYLPLVKRLGEEYVRAGPKVMGECMTAFLQKEGAYDLLGKAYMIWGINDRGHFAQYFTPDNVAECMAKMTLHDIPRETLEKPEGLRMMEPCCGSGVMLLHALAEIRRQHGAWGLSRTRAFAVDLDPLCCKMTAVQLLWFMVVLGEIGEVSIWRGNSLCPPSEWEPVYQRIGTPFEDEEPWQGPPEEIVQRTKAKEPETKKAEPTSRDHEGEKGKAEQLFLF